ncbi:N-formylglutamate amidohydrolase [Fretibacter rubidus]|uniref:N-formylglutamate amidohydrolase n=1 Tax=Fretibacter rubidus TaxID=570162 RepID=UPI00352BCF3B
MTPSYDKIAYHTLAATSDAPLFIFGDHASKLIPAAFHNLGLSGDDLTRHIAWDIGTEVIIRNLCAHFGCGAHLAAVSRLVIDMNRDPDAPGLIPVVSDGTIISGNEHLSAADRQARIDGFYRPYHARLGAVMHRLASDHARQNPLVISLHSFTPKPAMGEARPTDIGLLTKHDTASAKAFIKTMADVAPDMRVDINLPYSAYDLNYTVDVHVATQGLRHLAIELRQDHVDDKQKQAAMTDILIRALSPLL